MKIREIMTEDPACCTPQSKIEEAARLMVDFDCGEIPVVDDFSTSRPIGVVTDRDIVCRTIGKGLNPMNMSVGDCMSKPLVALMPETLVDECYQIFEQNQIRRAPVVDVSGKCVGIVSLADIVKHISRADSGEILHEVSEPSLSASSVGQINT